MANIATRMAEHDVSLESIVQKRAAPNVSTGADQSVPQDDPATVVLITHETTEQAVRSAVSKIEDDGKVTEKPQVIRIEQL